MRQSLKIQICVLAGLTACWGARAIARDPAVERYQLIPERNVFGLKPIEQAHVVDAPPPSLPRLILTGITTILGDKRVLMKAQPVGGKGEQAKEESLILSEGQREGYVEVLKIDEKAGSVEVRNSGTLMTLTFEKDGAKLPSTPQAPAPPPSLPSAATTIPAMAANLGNPVRPHAPRTLLGQAMGGAVSPPSSAGAASGPGGIIPSTPGLGNSMPVGVPTAASALPADLTSEEQMIIRELQKQAAQAETVAPSIPLPGAAPTSNPGVPATPVGTVPGNSQPVLPQ